LQSGDYKQQRNKKSIARCFSGIVGCRHWQPSNWSDKLLFGSFFQRLEKM